MTINQEKNMTAQITLEIIGGKLPGESLTFSDRSVCIMGRANDCDPLSSDLMNGNIERFSIDKLVMMIAKTGMKIHFEITAPV
jgi:Helix-turn-helix domain